MGVLKLFIILDWVFQVRLQHLPHISYMSTTSTINVSYMSARERRQLSGQVGSRRRTIIQNNKDKTTAKDLKDHPPWVFYSTCSLPSRECNTCLQNTPECFTQTHLSVRFVLNEFLRPTVQKSHMGVCPHDWLSRKCENQSKHTVSCRMLGSKVHDDIFHLSFNFWSSY